MLVHKWRSEEQAILVGTNTVEVDDPALDVRDWAGNSPIRLIIDRKLKLASDHKVFKDSANVLVFTAQNGIKANGKEKKVIDFNISIWPQIMNYLSEQEIASVFVEGGAKTINSLIEADMWDEARVFTGEQKFKNGILAPRLEIESKHVYRTWQSDLKIYYR
jgi:diaminohydroxyphosphoribosylaminopyrimidine deaminase/5-amino-6-(5-phosphoribosylamino)uracil reductase